MPPTPTTEQMDEISPVSIGNENLRRLKEEKEQILAEIRETRTQNENLQRICSSRQHSLAVAQDHFDSEGISELEDFKANLLAEIESTKDDILEIQENVAYAGNELQNECIMLTEGIASMHLEYKSNESLQNGGKTKLVKIQEMKKQNCEADKAIANFQRAIAEVNASSRINLDEAMLLIVGADECLLTLESQAAKLKEQIANLKQRNVSS